MVYDRTITRRNEEGADESSGSYSPEFTAVVDEQLAGTVNGSNTVFTTAADFVVVQVYKNGMAMHLGADFSITGSNQITFVSAPKTGSRVTATYYTATDEIATVLTIGNADTVDGFNASNTPTAGTIPVLDGNGKMAASTTQVESAFYAYPSGALSVQAATAYTLNTTRYNIGGHYNTGTGAYTVPYNGIYTFTGSLYTEATTTTRAFVTIQINSSIQGAVRGQDDETTRVRRAIAMWEGYLEAGDTVQFGAYSATTVAAGHATFTYFSGRLVART